MANGSRRAPVTSHVRARYRACYPLPILRIGSDFRTLIANPGRRAAEETDWPVPQVE